MCTVYQKNYPHIKIAMGGGFPNTELEKLKIREYLNFLILSH
jgi:hypothetical protein